ncbi:MAG TPA: cadherin-like domain-containing protein, partial [Mycoplana sp.]|nr:cadherin-like domain-containing protein [Mycoplana sp.]
SGEDVLGFTNNNSTLYGNISASYDAATGELTLESSGQSATLAQWTAALRAVTYLNTSEIPSTSTRTLSFSVNDGLADSNAATKTLTVAAINDSPVVATSAGSTAFEEGLNTGSAPVAIDTGLTLSDPDNGTLASATIRITGNFQSGEDVLGFTNNNSTLYGNISASYDAATGELTLLSSGQSATLAQWTATLRAVTYLNTSEIPSTSTRTLSFSVHDGLAVSNVATKTLTVASINDAPEFHDLDNAPVYMIGTAPVALDTDVTLIDPDLDFVRDQNGDYAGSTLTIARSGGPIGNDVFSVGGGFFVAGNKLYNPEGDQIASITQNAGGIFQVAFTGPSPVLVTSSLVNAFLRGLQYSNTGSVAESVQIDFTFSDGNAGDQGPGGVKTATGSVSVAVVMNAPPVLTGDLTATVKQGASYTLTKTDLYFADPDDVAADVTFTVSSQVAGKLLVNGTAATSFTGAELAAGKVTFLHGGSKTTTASFNVFVEDGDEDGSTPVVSIFNFTVTPANISGTTGSDKLTGTSGSDVLDGKGGNDTLKGGAGNDTLIGGTGVDILTGGAGRDVFVFASVKDSAPGHSGFVNNGGFSPLSGGGKRDIVTDFARGEDRLDVSKIDADLKLAGDQAFVWRGKGEFSGKAGELIFRTFDVKGKANDRTIVYGDVNRDGRADFQIELAGIINLTKGDFIL